MGDVIIPTLFFLKKRRGYCIRLRPSVRLSVWLFSPKPLDEIQPNLVCELLTWLGRATAHFTPPLGAPGRGQKVKYHLMSITKSISKIFIPNLQMQDTKHISRDFRSVAWVMPKGSDFAALRVSRGSKNMVMWHIKSTGMKSRTEC